MTKPKPPPDCDQLRRRLNDGRAAIDRATSEGHDVQSWESYWLSMLKEYEEICFSIGHGDAARRDK